MYSFILIFCFLYISDTVMENRQDELTVNVTASSALNDATTSYRFTTSSPIQCPTQFLHLIVQDVQNRLFSFAHDTVKVDFTMRVFFMQVNNKGEVYNRTNMPFHVAMRPLEEINLESVFENLITQIEEFINLGSDWLIDSIESLEMNIAQYNNIREIAGRSNHKF